MRKHTLLDAWLSVFTAMAFALLTPAVAAAGPGGGHGGGGGFHGGGGGGGFHGAHGGRYARGGYRGSRGYYAGGAYRGGRGYYSGHGYYGGAGYYGRGYRGWHGWLGGVGLGVYVPVLPWYYETLWWGDVPYYYADDTYYVWDDGASEYQAFEPPADLRRSPDANTAGASGEEANSSGLFAYPKGGQSEEQQTRDRDECRQWAASQPGGEAGAKATGASNGSQAAAQVYLRAEAACLEGRNYTVR
jgi:hypothetical protein